MILLCQHHFFLRRCESHGAMRTDDDADDDDDDDGHFSNIFSTVGCLALSLFILRCFLKTKSSFKVANKALKDRSL